MFALNDGQISPGDCLEISILQAPTVSADTPSRHSKLLLPDYPDFQDLFIIHPSASLTIFSCSTPLIQHWGWLWRGKYLQYTLGHRPMGRLAEPQARWIFQQLIIGLDYCHSRVRFLLYSLLMQICWFTFFKFQRSFSYEIQRIIFWSFSFHRLKADIEASKWNTELSWYTNVNLMTSCVTPSLSCRVLQIGTWNWRISYWTEMGAMAQGHFLRSAILATQRSVIHMCQIGRDSLKLVLAHTDVTLGIAHVGQIVDLSCLLSHVEKHQWGKASILFL